jgi:hypothetical protein
MQVAEEIAAQDRRHRNTAGVFRQRRLPRLSPIFFYLFFRWISGTVVAAEVGTMVAVGSRG